VEALLTRCRQLAGRSLEAIAAGLAEDGEPKEPVPEDLRRHKGWTGRLLERCLGAPADNRAGPDLVELGVEIKTLPLNDGERPRESTYVTRVPLNVSAIHAGPLDWRESTVYQKLRCVLWIPIQAAPGLPVAQRKVGQAFLWRPSEEEERTLRRDWEGHLHRIREGEVDAITARDGQVLQIRPKAAHGRQRTWGTGDHESVILTQPRGFYLRAAFTAYLLQRYFFDAEP
jgi:DNA mismatch repair protein MutH